MFIWFALSRLAQLGAENDSLDGRHANDDSDGHGANQGGFQISIHGLSLEGIGQESAHAVDTVDHREDCQRDSDGFDFVFHGLRPR